MKFNSESKVLSRVKKKKSYEKPLVILLIILLIQFLAVEALIISSGKSNTENKTDYLIILGAGIKGEVISLSLKERLAAGFQYLQQYPDMLVVVSGGQGRGEDIPEAEAMKRFLVAKGIDESRILVEASSTSTMENFSYSKKIIEQKTGKAVTEITYITNSFHILRSGMLARRNGFDAYAISCKTPVQVTVQMHIREYFALIKSFIIDR